MENNNKPAGKGLRVAGIAAIAVLAVAVVYLFISLGKKTQENEEMVKLFELEKEEMENEYSSFAIQYDEMQVHLSNDSLVRQLEKEKLRTQQLLEELRQTKASNAAEIRRLKNELATVRAVMRSYVHQIDSLDQINKKLVSENTQIRRQNQEATRTIETLTEEKQRAEDKVALASQLDAVAISFVAHNKRGKSEKKVKNVTQLVFDFTIAKNITVDTGEKTVYLRIMQPDGEPLVKAPENLFHYQNRDMEYSIKKYIEYTGEQQQVTMYWDVEEFLYAGEYSVFIFVDGVMIGDQTLTLQ